MNIDSKELDQILKALDRQIWLEGGEQVSLVVIGGAALNALGLISRTTMDVDVLGEILETEKGVKIRKINDFPDFLKRAIEKVQRDFGLQDNWFNLGPASQLDLGLPSGFESRLIRKNYGKYLSVYFPSRWDLIHLKFFASIDRNSYHVQDLLNLNPTEKEIESAARWVLTQDVSQEFRLLTKNFLKKIGYEQVAEKL